MSNLFKKSRNDVFCKQIVGINTMSKNWIRSYINPHLKMPKFLEPQHTHSQTLHTEYISHVVKSGNAVWLLDHGHAWDWMFKIIVQVDLKCRLFKHPFKKLLCFNHPVGTLIFKQSLIVLAQSSTKDDSCNTIKEMNPFSPLIPLASHVKQSIEFTPFLCLSNRTASNLPFTKLSFPKEFKNLQYVN